MSTVALGPCKEIGSCIGSRPVLQEHRNTQPQPGCNRAGDCAWFAPEVVHTTETPPGEYCRRHGDHLPQPCCCRAVGRTWHATEVDRGQAFKVRRYYLVRWLAIYRTSPILQPSHVGHKHQFDCHCRQLAAHQLHFLLSSMKSRTMVATASVCLCSLRATCVLQSARCNNAHFHHAPWPGGIPSPPSTGSELPTGIPRELKKRTAAGTVGSKNRWGRSLKLSLSTKPKARASLNVLLLSSVLAAAPRSLEVYFTGYSRVPELVALRVYYSATAFIRIC